jgi:hypothetical protein
MSGTESSFYSTPKRKKSEIFIEFSTLAQLLSQPRVWALWNCQERLQMGMKWDGRGFSFLFFFFFFLILGLELRAFTFSHFTSPFFFFEIESLKLFAQAGFKP